ncbi:MAG: DNA cytosine methyltransferase [bacterium]|nr:DNA cytosine methyltransferase [bacterium]
MFTVVDLFSGAGGMSFGFHKHDAFNIKAAADAEHGKPSTGYGRLQCNSTYSKNIGISPVRVNLATVKPPALRKTLGLTPKETVDVLSACPPCTGFSRQNPNNHLFDDARNSLVRKSAEFAVALDAKIVVMENARELVRGNFNAHYEWYLDFLQKNNYSVVGKVYILSRFGLPQIRERSIIIAAKNSIPLYTMDDMWTGRGIRKSATFVRRAIGSITPGANAMDIYPKFSSNVVRDRLAAIPTNGGSWMDLLKRPDSERLLTDSMKRIVTKGRIGSYPDVYGRMWWNKPSPTIKRECAHIGNGRYAHPEKNRLCSVREMAVLQGFPHDFVFNGTSISNMYRHIGDAVPPLISYQLSHLCNWMLTGKQPDLRDVCLQNTNLAEDDIVKMTVLN